jgi:hypothetical protein
VSSYPIEPEKLLDAAERLAPAKAGRGRPPYTAHRRAVSTAYYAVFHAVTARVAEVVFPSADDDFRNRVRRWIGHGDVRTVAGWVSQVQGTSKRSLPPHIAALGGGAAVPPFIDADTGAIADGFLDLNDKREQADYDHEAIFTRADTRGHLALARATVHVVEGTRTDEAACFFGLIALQARIQNR